MFNRESFPEGETKHAYSGDASDGGFLDPVHSLKEKTAYDAAKLPERCSYDI